MLPGALPLPSHRPAAIQVLRQLQDMRARARAHAAQHTGMGACMDAPLSPCCLVRMDSGASFSSSSGPLSSFDDLPVAGATDVLIAYPGAGEEEAGVGLAQEYTPSSSSVLQLRGLGVSRF